MKIDFKKPIDNKEIDSLIDPKYNYHGYIPEYKNPFKPWMNRDLELIFREHQDIKSLEEELYKLNKDVKFSIRHKSNREFIYTGATIIDYCAINTEIIDTHNTIITALEHDTNKLSYDEKLDVLEKYKNILSFIKREY